MAETDEKTLALIAEIKKQKKEIEKVDRPSWRTNCAFSYIENSSAVHNLQVVSNVSDIISIAAFLIGKKKDFEGAAKLLDVDSPPKFKWLGYAVEDWVEDLKLRISKIQINTKRKKLENLEARLNLIISPELRAKIELDAITEELES